MPLIYFIVYLFNDDKLLNISWRKLNNLLHVVYLKMFQMLAKGVIEDRLLSFVTQDAPDAEDNGEPMSQKVIACG